MLEILTYNFLVQMKQERKKRYNSNIVDIEIDKDDKQKLAQTKTELAAQRRKEKMERRTKVI